MQTECRSWSRGIAGLGVWPAPVCQLRKDILAPAVSTGTDPGWGLPGSIPCRSSFTQTYQMNYLRKPSHPFLKTSQTFINWLDLLTWLLSLEEIFPGFWLTQFPTRLCPDPGFWSLPCPRDWAWLARAIGRCGDSCPLWYLVALSSTVTCQTAGRQERGVGWGCRERPAEGLSFVAGQRCHWLQVLVCGGDFTWMSFSRDWHTVAGSCRKLSQFDTKIMNSAFFYAFLKLSFILFFMRSLFYKS